MAQGREFFCNISDDKIGKNYPGTGSLPRFNRHRVRIGVCHPLGESLACIAPLMYSGTLPVTAGLLNGNGDGRWELPL